MAEIQDKNDALFLVSSSTNILHKQKRILSEIKDQVNILPKKVKTECQDDEQPHDVKMECQQVVDEFKKHKFAFVQLLSRMKLLDYLENVPSDEWPSVTSCDEESKQVRSQLKSDKTSANDLEEHLRDMIKATQNNQETLEALLDTFEKRLGQVQDKMATLNQIVEARSHSLAELEDGGVTIDNFQERFEQEATELRLAEETLTGYQSRLPALRQRVADIHKQHQSAKAETELARQALSNVKAANLEKQQQERDTRAWCESAYKTLVELKGVSERSLEDNCWTLDLNTAGCSSNFREGMTASLSLHFKPGTEVWSPRKLSSATINIETFDISDLVEEAVRRNNVVFLVSAVLKRLRNHAPLFMEVEQLRHHYALDWLSEEGILKVILGDRAQIVCTLTLATGPHGSTIIKLKSIEGIGGHPPLEDLKPPQETPRISDWLEYLHKAVQNL